MRTGLALKRAAFFVIPSLSRTFVICQPMFSHPVNLININININYQKSWIRFLHFVNLFKRLQIKYISLMLWGCETHFPSNLLGLEAA